MADMRGTTPVKSIRMSDETKGLFDKINKEFGSQDRTMRALISAYESCAIGELYPESKSYITDALAYISGIEAIIKALITAKEEAEKTAAENVRREMEIKDRTIETYQKQVAELDAVRARAEAAEIRADKAEDTVRRLEKELDGVQVLRAGFIRCRGRNGLHPCKAYGHTGGTCEHEGITCRKRRDDRAAQSTDPGEGILKQRAYHLRKERRNVLRIRIFAWYDVTN